MVTLRGGSPPSLSNHPPPPPPPPLALPLALSLAGSSQRSSLLAHLSSTPAPAHAARGGRDRAGPLLLRRRCPPRAGTCLSLSLSARSRGNFGVERSRPRRGQGPPVPEPGAQVAAPARPRGLARPQPPTAGGQDRARRAAATVGPGVLLPLHGTGVPLWGEGCLPGQHPQPPTATLGRGAPRAAPDAISYSVAATQCPGPLVWA